MGAPTGRLPGARLPVGVVPATVRVGRLLICWRPAQPRPWSPTVSGGAVTALPSGSRRSGVAKHLRVAPPAAREARQGPC